MIYDIANRIAAILTLALGSALCGSFAGAVFYVGYEYVAGNLPSLTTPTSYIALAAIFSGFLVTSPFVLLIGVPLAWPFRKSIMKHPLIAAPVYALIGASVALALVASGFDWSPSIVAPFVIYGATTAMALVWMLWLMRSWLINR